MLFPADKPTRIPVVVLLGTSSQTRRLRRDIEAVATRVNVSLGVVLSEGSRDRTLPSTRRIKDAETLYYDTQIEAAVIEMLPEEFGQSGVGFKDIDLAVLVAPDGPAAYDHAFRALARIAKSRLRSMDDPAALTQSLEALNLPTDAVSAVPAAVDHASEPLKLRNEDEFTALFLGDVGFGEAYMHNRRAADLKNILATDGPSYSLANLQNILGLGDLTIANLEVPLSAQTDTALNGRKKYLGWCNADSTVAALKEAGIDAVTLANNHALDCGTAGLAETVTRLRKADIASFGAGRDATDAALPYVRRFIVGGVEHSLVVFGGFEHRARYENQYRWYASRNIAGIGKLAPGQIAHQINLLRSSLRRPIFVAFPHWGLDYSEPTDSQRATAVELADVGLDLIIGHGSHSIQPTDTVNGCPVIYNIGNFAWNTPGRFDKTNAPPFGLAVALTFQGGQSSGPLLRLYPIMTDNSVTGFQNRPVTTEEFSKAVQHLSGGAPQRYRTGQDAVGYHLELELSELSSASKPNVGLGIQ